MVVVEGEMWVINLKGICGQEGGMGRLIGPWFSERRYYEFGG